ncbi:unnamed protein product [Polarella glacialis]|uniref:Uncharacterized protein n=1 Tax=Polarella glacialis TaxID=89957 RepID=A0A813HCG0_POLGL|nr:unnamed protein product [Polarella glacialis]
MIELRQVGYVEINGANTDGIFDKLNGWLKQKWSASQIQADPQYCDLKFSTSSFKSRGSEGENNMGLRSMELVDFMTQQCSWTLITCNGGNFGLLGDKREQQLVFRCDDHVQHGEHHVMVEFRDQGYIEVNGLHDAQDVKSALDDYYIRQGCTHYTQGFFEKEPYCDLKYKTPGNFYFRSGSTNNLGKRTTELAHFMGNRGWKLMLCNGGKQQVKFTRARPGEPADLPLLMIEMRTVPTHLVGYQGFIEVNGPNTNGIYEKLGQYLQQTMLASPMGPQPYCDFLYGSDVFRLKECSTSSYDRRYNGYLNGESNFGRYCMRLCDFMVDHVGTWDLVVCNGNSMDTNFRVNKQQLIFRYRPGGRNVFMADNNPSPAIGRPPLQAPAYWDQQCQQGKVGHMVVPATAEEKAWLQEVMDGTYKKKSTRDRQGGPMAERFRVVSALRSEHPELWDKYANRRKAVRQGSEPSTLVVPKTMDACRALRERCTHPTHGNPSNEAFLLHGSNPTSAMSIS